MDGQLEREIVRKVYNQADVPIGDLPAGVFVEWRDGLYIGVNYSGDPVVLPIPEQVNIILGENPLQPAQVMIWKE
ncbi:MAG: hypothetical protein H6615_11795 [Ignavibacteria bacterium]|mgnify:FL=1|nr:hypothetical protein [Ignavibacteria bacterium]